MSVDKWVEIANRCKSKTSNTAHRAIKKMAELLHCSRRYVWGRTMAGCECFVYGDCLIIKGDWEEDCDIDFDRILSVRGVMIILPRNRYDELKLSATLATMKGKVNA